MRNYLIVMTGGTEPSHEEVTTHEHALRRYCEDINNGEMKEGEDLAFVVQVNEDGDLSTYPFTDSEVEEMMGILIEEENK